MIALRGKFEQLGEDAAAVWKFKGHWAFGNEVPVNPNPDVKPAVRLPFLYKWDRIVTPDQVALPTVDTAAEEQGEDKQKNPASEQQQQQEDTNAPPKGEPSSSAAPAERGLGKGEGGKKEEEKQKAGEASESKSGEEAAKVTIKDTPVPVVDPETASSESKATAEHKPSSAQSKQAPSSEKTKDASSGDVASKEQTKDDSGTKPEAVKIANKPKPTFADKTNPDDPDFTDACTKHKDKVPPSGAWVGYFEAATGKKGPNMRIHETFFLFLNATPAEDARTRFPDEALSSPTTVPTTATTTAARPGTPEPGALPPGHLHARGMGQNQYGTFELVGSLDLESGILNLQRMYVITPESSRQRSPPRGRGRGRGRGRPSLGSDDSSESRPTRKRQLSWKRRAAYEDETAVVGEQPQRRRSGMGGRGPGRKRLRVDTTTPVTSEAAASVLSSNTPTPVGGVVAPVVAAAATTSALMPSTSAPAAAAAVIPSILPATAAAVATPATATTNIPLAPAVAPPVITAPRVTTTATTPGPRKRATAASAGVIQRTGITSTSSSSGGGGTVMRLPASGDPIKARWRAAHFLYYQRPEPVGDDGSTASGNKGSANAVVAAATASGSGGGSQQPKYVVYEGEMMDSMRDGRGICLYSNGMLYEGEWKNDKEHGIGKLMSADRKRVIYRGEFEKGRIHGNGVYYYYPNAPSSQARKSGKKVSIDEEADSSSTPKIQSRYEGEFKESLRHGAGAYYLPDGSVYNGSFQNNQFSGRGIFTWPDGSVYDGEWRDGKRHGLGLLRASDGFTYDGAWVDNAMEGRGCATYPDGQQYNGLFSQGRREGRGTILFTNGAVYEGRFRDDAIDGQGTMKMGSTMVVPRTSSQAQLSIEGDSTENDNNDDNNEEEEEEDGKLDFMIPVSFQSDIGHIHRKAGFTHTGK